MVGINQSRFGPREHRGIGGGCEGMTVALCGLGGHCHGSKDREYRPQTSMTAKSLLERRTADLGAPKQKAFQTRPTHPSLSYTRRSVDELGGLYSWWLGAQALGGFVVTGAYLRHLNPKKLDVVLTNQSRSGVYLH